MASVFHFMGIFFEFCLVCFMSDECDGFPGTTPAICSTGARRITTNLPASEVTQTLNEETTAVKGLTDGTPPSASTWTWLGFAGIAEGDCIDFLLQIDIFLKTPVVPLVDLGPWGISARVLSFGKVFCFLQSLVLESRLLFV